VQSSGRPRRTPQPSRRRERRDSSSSRSGGGGSSSSDDTSGPARGAGDGALRQTKLPGWGFDDGAASDDAMDVVEDRPRWARPSRDSDDGGGGGGRSGGRRRARSDSSRPHSRHHVAQARPRDDRPPGAAPRTSSARSRSEGTSSRRPGALTYVIDSDDDDGNDDGGGDDDAEAWGTRQRGAAGGGAQGYQSDDAGGGDFLGGGGAASDSSRAASPWPADQSRFVQMRLNPAAFSQPPYAAPPLPHAQFTVYAVAYRQGGGSSVRVFSRATKARAPRIKYTVAVLEHEPSVTVTRPAPDAVNAVDDRDLPAWLIHHVRAAFERRTGIDVYITHLCLPDGTVWTAEAGHTAPLTAQLQGTASVLRAGLAQGWPLSPACGARRRRPRARQAWRQSRWWTNTMRGAGRRACQRCQPWCKRSRAPPQTPRR